MLKRFFSIFFLMVSLSASAQNIPSERLIKYKVIDSISLQPIPFATLKLMKKDKIFRIVLADRQGIFTLMEPDETADSCEISCIGYTTRKYTKGHLFFNASDDTDIRLFKLPHQLDEVRVTAPTTLLERKVDRLIYNVQLDPEKTASSMIEIFRKLPLITISGNQMLLNGSSGYKILINGRPASLFANNPMDALKAISANDISKVEIITTPPAKYDGEGLAGIINIITLSNKFQGFKARISMRSVIPDGPSTSSSVSIKYKKIGINASGGTSTINSPSTNSSLSRNSAEVKLEQSSLINSSNHFSYGHIDFSYDIDSLNLLTVETNVNRNSGNTNLYQQSFEQQLTPIQNEIYDLYANKKNLSRTMDATFNYEIALNSLKKSLLTLSYKVSTDKERSSNLYHINEGPINLQNNPAHVLEQTSQIDYTNNLKYLSIEAGVKLILRKNVSEFAGNSMNDSPTPSDYQDFKYYQNILAFYNAYEFKLLGVNIKTGVRLEQTYSKMRSRQDFSNQYMNLIPSVSLMRALNDRNSISFGYSNRLERPGIIELNPFTDRSDSKSLSTGNPYLHSSTSNNIEFSLSHTGEISIQTGLNYAKIINGIDIYTVFDQNTGVYTSTYQNALNNKRVGFNFNISVPITTTFSLTCNSSISHHKLDGNVEGSFYKKSAWMYNIYGTLSKKLSGSMSTSFDCNYNNGILLLQGKTNHVLFYSTSINKSLIRKKVTIAVSVQNIFDKYRSYKYEINTNNSSQKYVSQIYNRKVTVGISYQFGKINPEIRTNQRTINNDDLRSSN